MSEYGAIRGIHHAHALESASADFSEHGPLRQSCTLIGMTCFSLPSRSTTNENQNVRKSLPAQMVDATLACSLLAGVSKPKVFLERWFKRSETWSSCA